MIFSQKHYFVEKFEFSKLVQLFFSFVFSPSLFVHLYFSLSLSFSLSFFLIYIYTLFLRECVTPYLTNFCTFSKVRINVLSSHLSIKRTHIFARGWETLHSNIYFCKLSKLNFLIIKNMEIFWSSEMAYLYLPNSFAVDKMWHSSSII